MERTSGYYSTVQYSGVSVFPAQYVPGTLLNELKDVAFSQSRAGISVMSALQVPKRSEAARICRISAPICIYL
jgi:hypothetical protein